jgi:hypothetical protein
MGSSTFNLELDKIIPVSPPTVNKKNNPIAHIIVGGRLKMILVEWHHLKNFTWLYSNN